MKEDSAPQRLMKGTSWEEFCDTLKMAGQTILNENAPDDCTEMYDFMSAQLRALQGGLYMRQLGLNLIGVFSPIITSLTELVNTFMADDDGTGLILREDMSDEDPLENGEEAKWQGRFSIN